MKLLALILLCAIAVPISCKGLFPPEEPKGIECSVCKDIIDAARDLGDMTEPELKAALHEACNSMGLLASMCKELVDKYLPEFYQWLNSELNAKEICQKLHLCSSLAQPKGIECTICKDIIQAARDLGDMTEPELKEALHEACNSMGLLASMCKELVDRYLPEFYQWLNSELNPEEICQKLDLCSSLVSFPTSFSICDVLQEMYNNVDKIVESAQAICDQIPDAQLKQICNQLFQEEAPKIEDFVKQTIIWVANQLPFVHCHIENTKSVAESDTVVCTVCKDIVQAARDIGDMTEPEMKAELHKICDSMGLLAGLCKEMVDQYLPQFYKWLDSEMNPEQICQELRVCSRSLLKAESFSICDVLQEMYDNVDKIVKAAHGICDQIPDAQLQQMCNQLFEEEGPKIEDYVKQIIIWIANELPFVHCNIGVQ